MFLQGVWHCSPKCFDAGLRAELANLSSEGWTDDAVNHRVPLGLLMLSQGLINQNELKEALRKQREHGTGRVGEWLQKVGKVNELQVARALSMQWSLPVYAVDGRDEYLECHNLIPLPLIEKSGMVPVSYTTADRRLYVAFLDRVDYTAVYASEQNLECRVEPCIAPQSYLERALDAIREQPRDGEFIFEESRGAGELSLLIRKQMERKGLTRVRLAKSNGLLWVRMWSTQAVENLVYRMKPSTRLTALEELR
jgi:hypothetical protein